ncbi:hypothetical protein [Rodentibacter haemolyticus]|uniref:Uncharacterized protein n=1 Tax=Rodentibacter haemolyticus TaxID=2778911 RepID=A0ABX6UZZ2_9PAST|nr:hypothetical protein [Rodentibacter haemolyticus]QPB42870.1 hypothetical protein IHV77_01720 [Rodentibacter haemolyticus]
MPIQTAYCVQLGRVVPITEARTEYLNQTEWKHFDFLCPTESCRAKGIKLAGINYQIHPSDNHRNSPHYRTYPGQKDLHCSDCYLSYDLEQQLPGETTDEFKLRKARARLNDYIDEFNFIQADESAVTVRKDTQPTKNASTSRQGKQEKNTETPYSRYAKTTQLVRLVESYLDSKNKLSETMFKKLPLKVEGSKVKYLYQYFYGIKKGIEYKKHCVYMGNAILKQTDKGLSFQFIETVWKNQKPAGYKRLPIYLHIPRNILESYRYKRALFDHIETNPYQEKQFKIFFIPNEEDIDSKTVNKDGKQYTFHSFNINDLRLFCLFTYSYLSKKK